MGIYDLPATIDYILKNTKTKDLTYVCFSQGCTQFLVMGSLKPEYNKKIKFVTSLAPAAFTKYLKGLLINLRPLINFTIVRLQLLLKLDSLYLFGNYLIIYIFYNNYRKYSTKMDILKFCQPRHY